MTILSMASPILSLAFSAAILHLVRHENLLSACDDALYQHCLTAIVAVGICRVLLYPGPLSSGNIIKAAIFRFSGLAESHAEIIPTHE